MKDITPGTGGTIIQAVGTMGGALYFGVRAGDRLQLWTSDGSAAGTVPVKTLTAHATGGILRMAATPSLLFFTMESCPLPCGMGDERAPEVWRTDGTAVGTRRE